MSVVQTSGQKQIVSYEHQVRLSSGSYHCPAFETSLSNFAADAAIIIMAIADYVHVGMVGVLARLVCH